MYVKSTCVDIELFNFMHHFLVHSKTEFSTFCNQCFASFSVLATDKITVSSANIAIVVPTTSGMSLIHKTYESGPKMILLYGTPGYFCLNLEYSSPYLMRNNLFFGYDLNKENALLAISHFCNRIDVLGIKFLCSIIRLMRTCNILSYSFYKMGRSEIGL